MDTVDPAHVAEPGLVVLDITAADEATAQAVMHGLEQCWATSGASPVRRRPGEPGVSVRVYADVRRPGSLDT
ncbi:DUF6207 family protein [Streptomyces sp. NPDC002889]|uniref:DUF6207 family protein n=1 Tax=Streptomyces sp. NPDC002889 TaxID=3364669 RepID=UPI00368C8F1C